MQYKKIIDISQAVDSDTACFPGDTPFTRDITVTYQDSKVINLTAFTMSPHVGTHADSPVHIQGELAQNGQAKKAEHGDTTAGGMALEPFIGPCLVLDLTRVLSKPGAITSEMVSARAREAIAQGTNRILFKTETKVERKVFKDDYSYIGADAAELLGSLGCVLVGLDTPSVDHIRAKDLITHKTLDRYKMSWLENLDLSEAQEEQKYFLLAAPLKMDQLEASPVRALLLQF